MAERRRARLATLVLLALSAAGPLAAQEAVADTVPADSSAEAGLSPRGAMLRSLVLPGWGQAAVGSYRRGAVFFAVRGTAAWMLFKTLARLDEVRSIEKRLVGLATDSLEALMAMDSLAAERLADPFVFQQAVDSFPGLAAKRSLIRSREQQRQDWIAYTVFFTLLDVLDAYVNAHLRDFPVSIETEPALGGGEFRVSVPLPWGGPPSGRRPTRGAPGLRPEPRRR